MLKDLLILTRTLEEEEAF